MLFLLFNLICWTTIVSGMEGQYSIDVHAKPTLRQSKNVYYAELQCSSNSAFDSLNEEFKPAGVPGVNEYDRVNLFIGEHQCPNGFLIGIAMFNEELYKNFEWSTWEMPLALSKVHFNDNQTYMVKELEFGNQFSLSITPKLAKDSKIFYRVNVYCAGSNRLEYKTYTQSDTFVVFKSIGRNCNKYDVKVWPTYQKWLLLDVSNEVIKQRELLQTEIRVKNGETHEITFKNQFNLKIEPALKAKSGTYFVEVSCGGRRKSPKAFKTHTTGKTKVVLGGPKCTQYDIKVSKLDAELQEANEITSVEAKHKELGLRLKTTAKSSSIDIKYTEEEIDHYKSDDEESEDEDDDDEYYEDEDDEDDGEEVNLADLGLDEAEIDRIINGDLKEEDLVDGGALLSGDEAEEGDDDDEMDEEDDEDENDEDKEFNAEAGKMIDELLKEIEKEGVPMGEYDENDYSLDGSDAEDSPKPKKKKKTKASTSSKFQSAKRKYMRDNDGDDDDEYKPKKGKKTKASTSSKFQCAKRKYMRDDDDDDYDVSDDKPKKRKAKKTSTPSELKCAKERYTKEK